MHVFIARCFSVGEEDEVSIKEAAEHVAEGMDFKGGLVVSFMWDLSNKITTIMCYQGPSRGRGWGALAPSLFDNFIHTFDFLCKRTHSRSRNTYKT